MKLQGWLITGCVTGTIAVGLLLWFLVTSWTASTMISAIDTTGRCSLFLFSIAFTASSSHHLWPSAWTQWTLRNRRWIGLSFASSHFIHLALIVSISLFFPEPFLSDQSKGQWIFGGLAYVFVFLMAVTSNDRSQQLMGIKNWRRLHLIGSYWIWTVFLLTYIKHAKEGGEWFFIPLLIFTIALLPIRFAKNLPRRPSLKSAWSSEFWWRGWMHPSIFVRTRPILP